MKSKNKILASGVLIAAAVSAPAAAQDGATLYSAKGCIACHGGDAASPINPAYPKLAGQNKQYLVQQIKDIQSGARDNGQTAQMKPIVSGLSDAEIQSIADYLSSL